MAESNWSRRDAMLGATIGVAALAMPSSAQAPDDAVDRLVADFMRAFGTPGVAVTIVRASQPVLARGYGVRRMGRPERVDADTLFGIASNTKAFVAAGLAMLVEAGKLGWDEPVVRYLPDFATSDQVVTRLMTVRDLLCHRSGLPLGAGDLMQFPLSDHSRADIYHGLKYLPFERGFRSGYAYDNILYVVAGVLIERVTGMSYEDYMTTAVLRPLGMVHAVADSALLRTANVAGRHSRPGPPVIGVGPLKVAEPDESLAGSPAGGNHASAREIALWLQTQLARGVTPAGRRLWSEANAAEMWTPQVITGTTDGPNADDPTRPVLKAYALGVPAFDWVAAAKRVQSENEAMARAAAGTGDFQPPPGGPSLPLAAYAGRFRDPWYGDIVVRADGAGLLIDFTRTPVYKSRLEPFGPDTFRTRFAPGTENAVVAFVIQNGRPVRLKLHPLSPLADFSYDFQHLTPVRVD